jgi:hypothetical protein
MFSIKFFEMDFKDSFSKALFIKNYFASSCFLSEVTEVDFSNSLPEIISVFIRKLFT